MMLGVDWIWSGSWRAGLQRLVVIFTIMFVVFCLIVRYQQRLQDVIWMKSSVDGTEYLVRNLPDSQQAANLLARLRRKLSAFVSYVETNATDLGDEYCNLQINHLRSRYKPELLSESPADAEHTSYSVNKKWIYMCLRDKTTSEFIDENVLTYVAFHELIHVMTTEVGHSGMFWENFRWALQIANQQGWWRFRDFSRDPAQYCGMTIAASPYDTNELASQSTPNKFKSCQAFRPVIGEDKQ